MAFMDIGHEIVAGCILTVFSILPMGLPRAYECSWRASWFPREEGLARRGRRHHAFPLRRRKHLCT